MRNIAALLIGILVAIVMGYLYMKFSGALSESAAQIVVEATPSSPSSFGSSNAILLAIVLFSWITAFISMPNWLSAVLDIAIGWLGLVLFMVTGVFVWMAQPSNTLQDPTYVTFLCSIAMVASRLTRILRVIIREEND